jgi:heme-degrading monooxygenase HmoA
MCATICFFFHHELNDVARLNTGHGVRGRDRSARKLSLIPRRAEDFERGNYGKCDYSLIEIHASSSQSTDDDAIAPDSASACDVTLACRLIEKIRGTAPANPGDRFFVTICNVAASDADKFMRQFASAAAYMRIQPGFVRLRLFESLRDEAVFRFVNIAQWRTMREFTEAFQTVAFKALIGGDFDHSSQLIVAGIAGRA